MADAARPPSLLRRALPFVSAALVGAAVLGLGLVLFGGDGGGPAAALGEDPGIPPPDYAYLDSGRVVLYLGQIEGGLSKSETQRAEVTRSRNAGGGAGGLEVGASAGSASSVERVVTPTTTAQFYRLLDRLRSRGYLRTVDAAASKDSLRRAFAAIPEGTFVQLRNCRLRLPTYVQLELLLRTSRGHLSAFDAYTQAGSGMPALAYSAAEVAKAEDRRIKSLVGTAVAALAPGVERRLDAAAHQLVRAAGPDPRVPLSTCTGAASVRPRGVDLLVPIQLRQLSSEQSLLAGPVTVVGKVVRAVRVGVYVDEAPLARFSSPVAAVDQVLEGSSELQGELAADVTVLSPGAVILPIAIYK